MAEKKKSSRTKRKKLSEAKSRQLAGAKKKLPPPEKGKAVKPEKKVKKPKPAQTFAQKQKLAQVSKKVKAQRKKFADEIIRPTGKTIPKTTEPPVKRPSRQRIGFDKTKTFRRFNKKFLRNTDKKYKQEIKDFWKQQYDKKIKLSEVLKQTKARYVSDTRNRLYKSKRPYWGKSAFKQDKKGQWIGGKPRKRYLWRDKLRGKWIRGKNVGATILKVLEPVHIKNYMKIHKIKNYQTARRRYLKETKNMALGQIIQLYGYYP